MSKIIPKEILSIVSQHQKIEAERVKGILLYSETLLFGALFGILAGCLFTFLLEIMSDAGV